MFFIHLGYSICIAFVITVVQQMDMFWLTMMLKIITDYIFDSYKLLLCESTGK